VLLQPASPSPGLAGWTVQGRKCPRAWGTALIITAVALLVLENPVAAAQITPTSGDPVAAVALLSLSSAAVVAPTGPLGGSLFATRLAAASAANALPGAASDSSAAVLTPRQALTRSAVLPGWGQFANGHPFKGLLFAGAAAGFLTAGVQEARAINDTDDPNEHERRAARRNTRYLLFVTTVTLAAVDAYVDAHLAHFGPEPQLDVERGLVALTCTWRF